MAEVSETNPTAQPKKQKLAPPVKPAILALPLKQMWCRTHRTLCDDAGKILGIGFEPEVAEAIVQAVNGEANAARDARAMADSVELLLNAILTAVKSGAPLSNDDVLLCAKALAVFRAKHGDVRP
jgi:hypothetical protein